MLIRNYSHLFIRRYSDLSLAISSSYIYSIQKCIYLKSIKLFGDLVWSGSIILNSLRVTSLEKESTYYGNFVSVIQDTVRRKKDLSLNLS